MKIVQKKGSNNHTFDLGEDKFNYAVVDKTGSADADIYYANLHSKTQTRIEENEWLRNASFLWMALGLFGIGLQVIYHESFPGKWFWLTVGMVCYAWYRYTRVKYTVFNHGNGNVHVIQDKNHDQIVSELMARRKDQIRKMYGEIDLENDPAREIEKFKWLLEQGVLTKEEADQKIAQVESSISRVVEYPRISLN